MAKHVVPDAKDALNRFKMEAANEVGVNLKNKPKGLARAGLIINAILLGLQVLGVIVFVVIAILATVFGVGTAFFALLMSVFSADSMQNLQMY